MSVEVVLPPRFTGIWQVANPYEQDWIEEIFKPYISSYVWDGERKLVLDDAILFDSFCATRDLSYYAQFRGKNAFLVHFLDETYEGSYEIYENFRGVIRCFWSDAFNPARVMMLPLGYNAGLETGRETIVPASQRRFVWSFLGQVNKSSRPDMARALVNVGPNFLFATDDVPGFIFYNRLEGGGRRLFPKQEFSEFLFESSFSPSPMGNANIECFRVYEALECGSIPIVESRMTMDYFRELLGAHPMPTVRSWTEARGLIEGLIAKPSAMDALQAECMEWWRGYKVQYTRRLGEFLESRSAAGDAAAHGPVMLPRYSRPGWQVRELLRHHDLRAFTRRMQKQVQRLVRTGGTRETHGRGRPEA